MLDLTDRKLQRRLSEIALNRLPNNGPDAERKRVLTLTQSVREDVQQLGHLPWGSVVLNIPVQDRAVLGARFPELDSPDPVVRSKAWDKFLASPESAPYRVRRNDGKKRRRPGRKPY